MGKRVFTVAIDFDGVISTYSGWKGKGVFGPPIEGVVESLKKMKELGWRIIINTTRIELHDVATYLDFNKIPFDFINHNPENVEQMLHPGKVLADVYIDDRSLTFNGVWDEKFFDEIANYKPWWRK